MFVFLLCLVQFVINMINIMVLEKGSWRFASGYFWIDCWCCFNSSLLQTGWDLPLNQPLRRVHNCANTCANPVQNLCYGLLHWCMGSCHMFVFQVKGTTYEHGFNSWIWVLPIVQSHVVAVSSLITGLLENDCDHPICLPWFRNLFIIFKPAIICYIWWYVCPN